MSRMVSFIILIAIILVMGSIFVLVMSQFLLPIFLAVLLVVMFRPLHRWLLAKCHGRNHLAAGLTTAAIVCIVLVPMLWVLTRALAEGVKLAGTLNEESVRQIISNKASNLVEETRQFSAQFGVEIPADRELSHLAFGKLESWIAPAALSTTQFLWNFFLGLFIMLVSLYFFLADGPVMVNAAMRLSPLDNRYQQQLLEEFDRASRAVVLATLLSALGHGVLAGFGYLLAGLPSVLLLSVVTMVFSLVPVVGTAAVWGSCSLWLYFYQERPVAAILLALWGAVIVFFSDNVLKPLVLRGQSNLHPLLALLSILGGIEMMGVIGLFVGPMIVSFLQALLVILRTELDSMEPKPPAPAVPA